MLSNDNRYAHAGSRASLEWRPHHLRGPYPTSSISGGQPATARISPRATRSISRGRPVPSHSHECNAFHLRGEGGATDTGLAGTVAMLSSDNRYAHAGSRASLEWRPHHLRGPYLTSSISGGQPTTVHTKPRTTSSISRGRPVPSESHMRDALCLRYADRSTVSASPVETVATLGSDKDGEGGAINGAVGTAAQRTGDSQRLTHETSPSEAERRKKRACRFGADGRGGDRPEPGSQDAWHGVATINATAMQDAAERDERAPRRRRTDNGEERQAGGGATSERTPMAVEHASGAPTPVAVGRARVTWAPDASISETRAVHYPDVAGHTRPEYADVRWRPSALQCPHGATPIGDISAERGPEGFDHNWCTRPECIEAAASFAANAATFAPGSTLTASQARKAGGRPPADNPTHRKARNAGSQWPAVDLTHSAYDDAAQGPALNLTRNAGGQWPAVDLTRNASDGAAQGPAVNLTHSASDDVSAVIPVSGGKQRAGQKGAPRRPPDPINEANAAAARQLGWGSAGLALLQAKRAAPPTTGATSNADDIEPRGKPLADVPLAGQPPRWGREFVLAKLPDSYVFDKFEFVALYEHSGEEREANAAARGAPACSVADRRSVLEPSAGCAHFIGDVADFLQRYPHAITCQSNHVTCRHANWASWATWPDKIADGSMLAAAEELLVASIKDDGRHMFFQFQISLRSRPRARLAARARLARARHPPRA